MKEIYDWVPWFGELAKKIADGDEEYLIERAKRVNWGKEDPPLLKFGDENIDPFSFFYAVAWCNGLNLRKEIYESISDVFEIEQQNRPLDLSLNKEFVIPAPPGTAVLFHYYGEGNPNFLWKLFKAAVNDGGDINPDDFKNALDIKNVRVAKLTQCLFLINPRQFIPIDDQTFKFREEIDEVIGLPSLSDAKKEIEADGWEKYKPLLDKFKSAFPGCEFFEINTVLYLMGQWEKRGTGIGKFFFQVSTNVYNTSEDYWKTFSSENRVFTGGPGEGIKFPLKYISKGDVILVRFKKKKGYGIGVVDENDYIKAKSYTEKDSIHVLWLNKSEAKLSGGVPIIGLSKAKKAYQTFADIPAYQPTFKLIELMRKREQFISEPRNSPSKMKQPLNQILYGPPGTGKTFKTTNIALEILDEDFYKENKEDRKKLRKRYEELRKEGRIDFVTFHQSFGYEEFVEGIRPIMGGEQDGDVSYEIRDGVFKGACERAASVKPSYPFDEAIENLKLACLEESLTMKTVTGVNIEVRYSGGATFQVRSHKSRQDSEKYTPANIESIKKVYRGADHRDFYNASYIKAIISYIEEKYDIGEAGETAASEPHVLIIDEINRGNISKIFGELITLLEESKRRGNEEAITVTLPYSGESFGVPNNLYIIGTMNTADRSIALLDTALRRRFHFEEMMPDSKKITGVVVDGIDVPQLMDAMNHRIRALYDRDHQIGHSYFMRLKSGGDIGMLKDIFRDEVLPLLQEYFYDDWGKINLIWNNNGFIKPDKEFPPMPPSGLVDKDRELWDINYEELDAALSNPDLYKKIYDNVKNDSSS